MLQRNNSRTNTIKYTITNNLCNNITRYEDCNFIAVIFIIMRYYFNGDTESLIVEKCLNSAGLDIGYSFYARKDLLNNTLVTSSSRCWSQTANCN